MSLPNQDPDDRTAWENLAVTKAYVEGGERCDDGRDKAAAIQALKVLYDQIDWIDWIERGIVKWREAAYQNGKGAAMARATARVAITHLQTIPNGRLDANQMFAAEKAARDWLESIGEEP